MIIQTVTNEEQTAGQRCARLLLELHCLIGEGRGDTDQADRLRDEMDPLWDQLDERERDRIGGLSEDLHGLREARPAPLPMDHPAVRAWRGQALAAYQQSQGGNVDDLLALLRRPYPAEVPAHVIRLLQARCWQRLGVPAVALVFLQAAEQSLFSEILAKEEASTA
jgi:hypothetical protein